MSEKKPKPLITRKAHNRCPVCGEISYSRAGVHPQCSVKLADEKRRDRLKREQLADKTKKTAEPASGIAPWQKRCPKCQALQHVRKSVCGCGYTFPAKNRPPTSDGD